MKTWEISLKCLKRDKTGQIWCFSKFQEADIITVAQVFIVPNLRQILRIGTEKYPKVNILNTKMAKIPQSIYFEHKNGVF